VTPAEFFNNQQPGYIPTSIGQGTLLRDPSDNSVAMICQVDSFKLCLIHLHSYGEVNGNRSRDPVRVRDVQRITAEEFDEIACYSRHWEIVTPSTVFKGL
jgi:hypothetical protein